MNWKNKQLSAIFIATFLYSVLVTSFYHHDDFSFRSGCGLCKFIAEACIADNAAPAQPVLPYFVPVYVFPEAAVHIGAAGATAVIPRAPPASVLSCLI